MRRKLFSFLMACLIVMSLVPITAVPVAAAAGLGLNPATGPVSQVVTLSGTGFAAASPITVKWDGAVIATTPATFSSDGTGAWTATITVPASTGGAHTILASDGAATPNTASSTFTVTTNLTITSPSPATGAVGTTVTLAGTGFGNAKTVSFSFAGTTVATTPTPVTSSATGGFSGVTFTVPASTAGAKTVTATDNSTTPLSASVSFTVTSQITIAPTTGPSGTSIAVTGTGFGDSKTVYFSYDGVAATTTPATVTSDATGGFTGVTFAVPASTAGSHTVAASDNATPANAATAAFTLTPQITLDPTSGAVGTIVAITGTGFGDTKIVTFTFGGNPIATDVAITGTDGSFGANIIVPATTAGAKTIVATDNSTTPITANAAFTVTSKITIAPNLGPVNTPVTVTGTGFPAGAVQILFNGVAVTTTPTPLNADASGNFTATIRVPTIAAGVYAITTTPASTSVNYTVTIPQIALSPATGPVGTTITVNGTGFAEGETGIALTYDGAPIATTPASISASGIGAWSATITAPPGITGAHIIDAHGATTGADLVADQTFTIVPRIVLAPAAGPIGAAVTVYGTGFTANELSMVATWDGGLIAGPVNANAQGSWEAAFTVPLGPLGDHIIDAYGVATPKENVPDQTFQVTASGIIIAPTSGSPGTVITVRGTGFGTTETGIVVTFNGNPVVTIPAEITASGGAWEATFIAPALPFGVYQVDAHGAATPAEAIPDQPFTLAAPGIVINPVNGPVGTPIIVNGKGFAPNETGIAVTFDGEAVTLTASDGITAGPNGTWTATFNAPEKPAGAHPVSAKGDVTPPVPAQNFTIVPSLTLAAASGHPGANLVISGKGFNPNAPINVTFDGQPMVLLVPPSPAPPPGGMALSGANGSWGPITVRVPEAVRGAHTIRASDGPNAAQKPFTIDPFVKLTPQQGPVGTNVLVNGSGFAANETGIAVKFAGSAAAVSPSTLRLSYDHTPSSLNWEEWQFSTEAADTTSITFNWNYSYFHSWFQVYARLYVFADGPSGRSEQLLYDQYYADYSAHPWGTMTVTGTASIQVHEGYNYGFIIKGKHYDSSRILQGTLIAGPFPGSWSSTGPGSTSVSYLTTVTTTPTPIPVDNKGGWVASFIVPTAAAGDHPVVAAGAVNLAEAEFTVTVPTVVVATPASQSGPINTEITVNGTGFAPGEGGINVTFGGESLMAAIIADESGKWTATVNAPIAHTGTHVIGAFGSVTIAELVTTDTFTIAKIDATPVQNWDTNLFYATIQAAIDAAETLDGHTILVYPGIYGEIVNITKQLKLISTDGAAATTINPGAAPTGAVTTDAVTINVDGTELKRFTITGASGSGVNVLASGCLVARNVITANATGITVAGAGNTIAENTITANTTTASGVHVAETAAGTTVSKNNISGNAKGIVQAGTPPAPLDARFNWWGDVSGPKTTPPEAGGRGDEISGSIIFSPWLGALVGTVPMTFYTRAMTDPMPNIQAAINAASKGDTILVYPGTYKESIVIDKHIFVKSLLDAPVTVIDGTGTTGAVVTITAGGGPIITTLPPPPFGQVIFSGFTVTNGATGIYVEGAPDPVSAPNPLIEKNIIKIQDRPSAEGIVISNTTAGLVKQNTIDLRNISSPIGILLLQSRVDVVSNTINILSSGGESYGIIAEDNPTPPAPQTTPPPPPDPVTIKGNHITIKIETPEPAPASVSLAGEAMGIIIRRYISLEVSGNTVAINSNIKAAEDQPDNAAAESWVYGLGIRVEYSQSVYISQNNLTILSQAEGEAKAFPPVTPAGLADARADSRSGGIASFYNQDIEISGNNIRVDALFKATSFSETPAPEGEAYTYAGAWGIDAEECSGLRITGNVIEANSQGEAAAQTVEAQPSNLAAGWGDSYVWGIYVSQSPGAVIAENPRIWLNSDFKASGTAQVAGQADGYGQPQAYAYGITLVGSPESRVNANADIRLTVTTTGVASADGGYSESWGDTFGYGIIIEDSPKTEVIGNAETIRLSSTGHAASSTAPGIQSSLAWPWAGSMGIAAIESPEIKINGNTVDIGIIQTADAVAVIVPQMPPPFPDQYYSLSSADSLAWGYGVVLDNSPVALVNNNHLKVNISVDAKSTVIPPLPMQESYTGYIARGVGIFTGTPQEEQSGDASGVVLPPVLTRINNNIIDVQVYANGAAQPPQPGLAPINESLAEGIVSALGIMARGEPGSTINSNSITLVADNDVSASAADRSATSYAYADAFATGIKAGGLIKGSVSNNHLSITTTAKGTSQGFGDTPAAFVYGAVSSSGISVKASPGVEISGNLVGMTTTGDLLSEAQLIPENLVVNPGFESGMEGWIASSEGIVTVDNTTAQSGSQSLKAVKTETTGPGGVAIQDLTGKIEPGDLYQLSGWIKTQDVVGEGFAFICLYYGAQSGPPLPDGMITAIGRVEGTTEWTRFVSSPFELPPPLEGSKLWLALGLGNATGTAWWDDISLTRVDEEALAIGGSEPDQLNSGLLVRRSQGALITGNSLQMTLDISNTSRVEVAPTVAITENFSAARAMGIIRSANSTVSSNVVNLNMTLTQTALSILPDDLAIADGWNSALGMMVRRSPGIQLLDNTIAVAVQFNSTAAVEVETTAVALNWSGAEAAGLLMKRSDGAQIKRNNITATVNAVGQSRILETGSENVIEGYIETYAYGMLVGNSDSVHIIGNAVSATNSSSGTSENTASGHVPGIGVSYWETYTIAEGIEVWHCSNLAVKDNPTINALAQSSSVSIAGETYSLPFQPMAMSGVQRIASTGDRVSGQYVSSQSWGFCGAAGVILDYVSHFEVSNNGVTGDASGTILLEGFAQLVTANIIYNLAEAGCIGYGIWAVGEHGIIAGNTVQGTSQAKVSSIANLVAPGAVVNELAAFSGGYGICVDYGWGGIQVVNNTVNASGNSDVSGAASVLVTRDMLRIMADDVDIAQDIAAETGSQFESIDGLTESFVSALTESIGIYIGQVYYYGISGNNVTVNSAAQVAAQGSATSPLPGGTYAAGSALNLASGIHCSPSYYDSQAQNNESGATIKDNTVSVIGRSQASLPPEGGMPGIDSALAKGVSPSIARGIWVGYAYSPVISGNTVTVRNTAAVNLAAVESTPDEETLAMGASIALTQGIAVRNCYSPNITGNSVDTRHAGQGAAASTTISSQGQAGQVPVDPAALGAGIDLNFGIMVRDCPEVVISGNSPVTAGASVFVQTGATEAAMEYASSVGGGLSLAIGIGVYDSWSTTIETNAASADAHCDVNVMAAEFQPGMAAYAQGIGAAIGFGIHVRDFGTAAISGNDATANCSGLVHVSVAGDIRELAAAGLGMADAIRVAHGNEAIIVGNTARDSGIGIHIIECYGAAVHGNNITGNAVWGVAFAEPEPTIPQPGTEMVLMVDATGNWWGHISGPSGYGPGTGDAVGPGIAYSPWFTRPAEVVAAEKIGYLGVERYSKLLKGWNIISTPIMLEKDRLGEIVDGTKIDVAYRFNAQTKQWELITSETRLKPLDAVYVYANTKTTAKYAFSPDLSSPPTRQLYAGWNLGGPAPQWQDGLFPTMPMQKALDSLRYVGSTDKYGYVIVVSPPVNQEGWAVTRIGSENPPIAPFEGYWVFLENDDILAGFSATPVGLPLPYVP